MNYKKTLNKALVIAASILALSALSGCQKNTQEATDKFTMPEGMEDCKVYYMSSSNGGSIVVVRCPNSATTTRSGKNTNVTVVDNAVDKAVAEVPEITQAVKNTDEVQINGETYRKSETMKEIEINGETYKKVQ